MSLRGSFVRSFLAAHFILLFFLSALRSHGKWEEADFTTNWSSFAANATTIKWTSQRKFNKKRKWMKKKKSASHKKIFKLTLFCSADSYIFHFPHSQLSIAAISFANNTRDCYTCLSYEVHEWLTRWRYAFSVRCSVCGELTSHMDLVNWATKTMLNDPLCENLTQNRHTTMLDASNVFHCSFLPLTVF